MKNDKRKIFNFASFFFGGGWHLISKIKKKLREIIIYKNNLIKIFSTDEIHTFNFKC